MADLKFRCDECWSIMPERHIKVVHIDHPKPGHDRVAINQCPECGEVNSFTNVCDEPGCTSEATCGWPTKAADYRRTCGPHMDADDRAK